MFLHKLKVVPATTINENALFEPIFDPCQFSLDNYNATKTFVLPSAVLKFLPFLAKLLIVKLMLMQEFL